MKLAVMLNLVQHLQALFYFQVEMLKINSA